MGCGGSKKQLEKVAAPTARIANHSSMATTHQSDINIKKKAPEPLDHKRAGDSQPGVNISPHFHMPKPTESISHASENLDVKAVLSPRSSGTFNVICWCNDAATLKQLAKDPLLEYVPEGSDQVIVFNRLSALSSPSLELPRRITAVVYLLSATEDIPMVREFYKDHKSVWNHFIVAGEDIPIPKDILMPKLGPEHNLPREIHNSYLDLITVVDAFLVTTKSSTFQSISMSVNSEVNELLDIAGGVDLHPRLAALREFWSRGRLALWTAKEKIAGLLASAGTQIASILATVQHCLSSPIPSTTGDLHLTFGDLEPPSQSLLSLHIGTNGVAEQIIAETAAVANCNTYTCWLALTLIPKPESVTIIENSQLSQLAKRTLDSIVGHDQKLRDLFGYDIK